MEIRRFTPTEDMALSNLSHGPIFTVYILGNRFTFVAETENVLEVLRTKEADFDEAVMQAVQRTVSISKESFHQNRSRLFKMIVRQLRSSNLHQFSETLCKEFHEHVEHLGKEGTEDLNELVRHVMYPTVMKTLFGKSFCPTSKSTTEEFEKHFQNYDEGFEFGSQMPEFFLRNWSKSKTWLLKEFERIVTEIKKHKSSESDSKTLVQHILDNFHGNGAPNYLLLLFWASQVNAVSSRNPNSPPFISSWIPWFGAAFQFGKAPLKFLEQARIKHGPIFTLYILGNRFTFVAETENVLEVLRTKEADFDEAVMQAVQRTVSISKESFHQNRSRLFKMIVRQLRSSNLHQFSETLCKEFHEHVEHLGKEGTEDLNELVRHVMYPTVMKTLFGKSFCPTSKSTTEEFEKHFQNYDEGFEFGSQMPEFFLRNWSKSKTWLLKEFERIVTEIKKHKSSESDSKTLVQHILDNFHGNGAPNYLLLLFWASQVNAVSGAFWTLAFILSHPSIYKNIMEDIVSVYDKAGEARIEISEDDLKKLPLIKQCILETLRLTSPGIIMRKAVKPIKVQNFVIPPGDLLMASPYWLHRNPKYFPEPELFKPDRWEEANLKNAFLDGYLAFGGGKNQCPGRWFALMETHMLVVILLYKYRFTLLDPIPKQHQFQ